MAVLFYFIMAVPLPLHHVIARYSEGHQGKRIKQYLANPNGTRLIESWLRTFQSTPTSQPLFTAADPRQNFHFRQGDSISVAL